MQHNVCAVTSLGPVYSYYLQLAATNLHSASRHFPALLAVSRPISTVSVNPFHLSAGLRPVLSSALYRFYPKSLFIVTVGGVAQW